jgi:hypothetical protein
MAWLMTGRYNTAAKTIELSEPIPGLVHGARVEIMVEPADHPEGPSFAAETLWAGETLAPEAESGIREISWEKAKGHLLQFCFTCFWAPVQAEGLLDGNRFSFRARHGLWRFALSEDPETVEEPHKLTSDDADKPGIFYIESGPGRDPDGEPDLEGAKRIIEQCAGLYLARRSTAGKPVREFAQVIRDRFR